MEYQKVFKRYELKYLLNKSQKNIILNVIKPYMNLDKYGKTTIFNIYYDTDNYRLIRRSIEKPDYKEKLRIRSYNKATNDSKIFVELKKKYNSIVYKRRISLKESEATKWLNDYEYTPNDSQITREINYFLKYYQTLKPKIFISYSREAYYCNDGSDLRITFDENIKCRLNNLTLQDDADGDDILDSNKVLMEIKCSKSIPLWLTSILSKEKIFKTSFSKYGTAYKTHIYPNLK